VTLDDVTRVICVFLALFLTMSGVAFFVVGLLPARSAPWFVQYAYAAVALTGAYCIFAYALS